MKLIECPRDAMQGIKPFIPTDVKIEYINTLLHCGFDTIDFGSFVSPRMVPQMQDTAEVLAGLDLSGTSSKLLAIVANFRGAETAASFPEIDYLGFPFSISETFQQRNTNSGINASLETVKSIQECCRHNDKTLVVYLSMAFGNPYGDPWSPQVVEEWTARLLELDIDVIALSDTAGDANSDDIKSLFTKLKHTYPDTEFGAHFHASQQNWREKIEAAYLSGCRRFDSAIKGFGGCPMAKDELVGNIATEKLIEYLEKMGENTRINKVKFQQAIEMSSGVFGE